MFYLTMHSAHFIYSYMALDLDSERGNPLPTLHGLLFLISVRVRVFNVHIQNKLL